MAKESRTEGRRQFNGGWAVKLTLRLNSPSVSTVTLSPFDNSSYPGRTKALSWPQWPISSFPITCPLGKTVEKENTEPLLQNKPKSLLTLLLCRYLQLGLQLLMMRDGSKSRMIPSVHLARGYSNLITGGCLENGITFSLQSRVSLRASDCPRSRRPHCLYLCT